MSVKSKYKLSFIIILIVAIATIIFAVNKLSLSQAPAVHYEFPLHSDDVESVLTEQKIDWYITDNSVVDQSRNMFTLKNDENITMGIDGWVKDNHKILNMTWFLPSSLTQEEVDDFFNNQLSRHFELSGIFYGNKKSLDKALNEMLSLYLNEENYGNRVYWNKRTGNDHLIVQIRPMSPNQRNQVISLQIIPNELYEDYLRATNNAWKMSAAENNIRIFNTTASEIEEYAKKDIPPINDGDDLYKHFIVHGSLENIKNNKKVPPQLTDINSNYIQPNKDTYLSAELVDDTGNINVLVEMTSLNKDELSMKRNHNIVVLYNSNEPVYIVRNSILYTEELRAQEIAKDFIYDLYTVSSEEVDNYKSVLGLITSDEKEFGEAIQINDEALKLLMTDNAYTTLVKNRQNLIFAKDCYEGNYTMQVVYIKLSENKNNIENNKAGYDYEIMLGYIYQDTTRTGYTSKGLIELEKIDGNWKITGIEIIN